MEGNDLTADLDAFLAGHEDELIEFRRDLHANPELGNREHRTAQKVAEHLKSLAKPEYLQDVLEPAAGEEGGAPGEDGAPAGEKDPLYDQAVEIVLRTRRPSISLVQRHLRIGYNRAARLIEDMERAGMVSPMQSNGNREVLVPAKAE